MKQKSSILVSHSGKQYVHRMIQGLLSNQHKVIFCSPLWFTSVPKVLAMLPGRWGKRISSEIGKRHFAFKGDISIKSSPVIAFRRKIAGYLGFNHDSDYRQLELEKEQDNFAASKISKINPDLIIGYEISSAKTFSLAKAVGKITILDLAQIHYLDILDIANRFDDMKFIMNNSYLHEINDRKQKEYELADFIITLSSLAKVSVLKRGINAEKVYTVNLGFDASLFTSKNTYSSAGPLKLLICGTDLKRKGLNLLLEVFHELVKGYPLELTIIGPMTETKAIKRDHGEHPHVHIYGFLSQKELVEKYQQADIFVFPSYLDSWAMTVLESMACGTPVIITDNTGSKDAVIKGGGVIIPTGDKKELKEALISFCTNRTQIEALGRKARAIALNFTWENYYNELGQVIGDIEKRSSHLRSQNTGHKN